MYKTKPINMLETTGKENKLKATHLYMLDIPREERIM